MCLSYFYNRVYILLNKIIGGIHMKYRHKKQERIELRVSDQQKAQIKSNANSLGLSLSKYILKMAEDGQIITIDSKNLANELYELNCKLNQLERYPAVRVQELRDVVSTGIARINELLKSGDDVVHTKI